MGFLCSCGLRFKQTRLAMLSIGAAIVAAKSYASPHGVKMRLASTLNLVRCPAGASGSYCSVYDCT